MLDDLHTQTMSCALKGLGVEVQVYAPIFQTELQTVLPSSIPFEFES